MPTPTLSPQRAHKHGASFSSEQIIDNLPCPVYICDELGYITQYNQPAADLWGREPEIGKDLWCGSWKIYNNDGSLMGLDECPMAIALKQGVPVYGHEIIIERPDGSLRNVAPYPKPLINDSGEVVGAINMLLDITEKKLREADEMQANARLEELIRQRTTELEKLNERLLGSNRELEQFAYIASHDLQEPLRKINAFGDMLSAKLDGVATPEGLDLIKRMQAASCRMKSLIDSLLSYSLLSSKPARSVYIDLNSTIAEVQEDMETSLKSGQGKISAGRLHPLQGDAQQIRQLFQNLISNSLKFRRQDTPPEIMITSRMLPGKESGFAVHEADQEQLFQLIEVKDNGIGFEQEYADRIFRLFERLHGKGEYPGNGMGLSIVQKVVDNHQGYIRSASEPGKGTTFQILLRAIQ